MPDLDLDAIRARVETEWGIGPPDGHIQGVFDDRAALLAELDWRAERYHEFAESVLKLGEDLRRVEGERDRARDLAVALEQQLHNSQAVAVSLAMDLGARPEPCESHGPDYRCVACATDEEILAALPGTGADGG